MPVRRGSARTCSVSVSVKETEPECCVACVRVTRGTRPGHPELLPWPHTPPLTPAAQETSLPVTGPEAHQGPRRGPGPSFPSARTLASAPHTPGRSPGLSLGPPAPCSPRQNTSLRLLGGSVWKRPVRAKALCTFRKTIVTWARARASKYTNYTEGGSPGRAWRGPVLGARCSPRPPPPPRSPRAPPPRPHPALTAAGT